MKLPIDTTGMSFLCASDPEEVVDFETKTPKKDEHGNTLYSVRLVVLQDGSADVVSVKLANKPDITQGEMAKPNGLIATPWTMGNRNGVAYRVDRLEADKLATKVSK